MVIDTVNGSRTVLMSVYLQRSRSHWEELAWSLFSTLTLFAVRPCLAKGWFGVSKICVFHIIVSVGNLLHSTCQTAQVLYVTGCPTYIWFRDCETKCFNLFVHQHTKITQPRVAHNEGLWGLFTIANSLRSFCCFQFYKQACARRVTLLQNWISEGRRCRLTTARVACHLA